MPDLAARPGHQRDGRAHLEILTNPGCGVRCILECRRDYRERRNQPLDFFADTRQVAQHLFGLIDRVDEIVMTGDAAAADFGGQVARRRGARLADGNRLRVGLQDLRANSRPFARRVI